MQNRNPARSRSSPSIRALPTPEGDATAHWHGATVLRRGSRTDTVELFPATTEVVDMRPDVAGTWLFHCHVADHMAGGMMTRYVVR